MERYDWELRGGGLASFVADRASADLASHHLTRQGESRSFRRMAGVGSDKSFMRAVGPNRLFAVIQRAVVNRDTKQLAQALKLRLRRIWLPPPELAGEERHRWRNLIATAGLSGRASNEARSRLFTELNEILIFISSDLAELRADQLHIVSEHGGSSEGPLRRQELLRA